MSDKKPPKLKLLQGNAGHRLISPAPTLPAAIPKPPKYLTAAARREWKHAAPLLLENGLISLADRELFGRWCTLVAQLGAYEKQLALEGAVLVAQSGYKMPHPLVAIINACSKQLVGLSDRFGLNPRARAAAHVDVKTEPDPFERYLAGGPYRQPGGKG